MLRSARALRRLSVLSRQTIAPRLCAETISKRSLVTVGSRRWRGGSGHGSGMGFAALGAAHEQRIRAGQSRRGFAKRAAAAEPAAGGDTIVEVPTMGESIVEGTLSAWLKNAGDDVEEDELICQIETDKITVDVRSPSKAVITELFAKEGDTVAVGQDLFSISTTASPGTVHSSSDDAGAKGAEAEATAEPVTSAEETKSIDILVPDMGESITEARVVAWLKEPGDPVAEDDVLAQMETDKVTVDVRSPKSGVFTEKLAAIGDTVDVGAKIAVVEAGAAPSKSTAPPSEPAKEAVPPPPPPPPPAMESKSNDAKAPERMDDVARKLEDMGQIKFGERRVAMTQMRKRIAERLKEAQNTAAILTTFNEADMSALMDLRSEYKDDFQKKHNVKLGFMSAFIKACTVALQEQPEVNAFIDSGDIVYRDYVDISVAVSTATGLVVPAIRNCETMSFADIEKTIYQLGQKAREGSITLAELQGGTFTISNGGVYGSLFSTPIINVPQSAILGMHSIQKRPVVVKDQIVIRPMMYLALSYDHRLIDGREAVTFLRRVKTLIEDPRRLLLNINL